MAAQTTVRGAAVALLALICVALLIFEIQAFRGRLIGNEWLGELFVLIVRQDGGIVDFAKQALVPIVAAATVSIRFTRKKDWVTPWLWGLLLTYLILTVIFLLEFQMHSIAEEIWVNDERETFIRDAENVAVNQAAFESAVRHFAFQSLAAIFTLGFVLLGIQSRDRLSEGGSR